MIFCSFWSMAVNTMDKLQFLSFIFAVLLSVTVHFIAVRLGRTVMHQHTKFRWNMSKWFKRSCFYTKSIKFYMQTRSVGSTHITMPNFLKTGLSKADILHCDFSIFQKVCRCHLGFLKLQKFIGYLDGEGRDTSARQISLKSVNQLWRY